MIFPDRATLALMTLIHWTRLARRAMMKAGYTPDAIDAITGYLALVVDRVADYASALHELASHREMITHTFAGFRLPMAWDFAEVNPIVKTSGGYIGQLDWVAKFVEHALLRCREDKHRRASWFRGRPARA